MAVKQFPFSILIALCLLSCSPQKNEKTVSLLQALNTPSIVEEGTISTGLNERDFSLSPDAKTILFTRQTAKGHFSAIYEMKKIGKQWSNPKMVSFCGEYPDLEPFFSPDGQWVYYASKRPKNHSYSYPSEDYDLWRVKVTQTGYGEPERLSDSVNTAFDEFFPAVTKNGNLYFTCIKPGGFGKEDIWVSINENGVYRKAKPLPNTINSEVYDFNAFVSADERLILFTSYGRAKGPGKGDLYFSIKNEFGFWEKAKLLPTTINTASLEYCPWYRNSDSLLVFTSERHSFSGKQQFSDSVSLEQKLFSTKNGLGDLYKVKWAPNYSPK